jgi:hypothetical protein
VENASSTGIEVSALPDSETGITGDLVGVVVDEHELPIEHACVQLR